MTQIKISAQILNCCIFSLCHSFSISNCFREGAFANVRFIALGFLSLRNLQSLKFCFCNSLLISSADFLMMAILTSMSLYLMVVLIYISLIISDVDHLFMCLLAICMSSLERCLFRSFAHFLNQVFFFSLLSVIFSFCSWFTLLCKSF